MISMPDRMATMLPFSRLAMSFSPSLARGPMEIWSSRFSWAMKPLLCILMIYYKLWNGSKVKDFCENCFLVIISSAKPLLL